MKLYRSTRASLSPGPSTCAAVAGRFTSRFRFRSGVAGTGTVLVLISALGCTGLGPDDSNGGDGDGDGDGDNNFGSGGDSNTGGAFGTGGGATGGNTFGVGGLAGNTGGTLNGTGGGSGGNVDDGSGGDASGGAGTGGASTGTPPNPSAGCNGGAQTVNVSNAIVGYPDGYNGTTPVPVIFAFHAAGNPHTQLESRFGNTIIGDEHLMIYLDATGSGWSMASDKSRFDTAMSQVLAGACVDQDRIYALGHSSGAQFIVQLLCAGESRFDAVIPIASSVYCSSWAPVPTLNIHGLTDTERQAYGLNDGNGQKDIVPYRTSNGCQAASTPSDIDTSGCGSNIAPGCVEFQGCSEPTIWCNHNDPQYGTSNHGIPCFATSAIHDFLSNL